MKKGQFYLLMAADTEKGLPMRIERIDGWEEWIDDIHFGYAKDEKTGEWFVTAILSGLLVTTEDDKSRFKTRKECQHHAANAVPSLKEFYLSDNGKSKVQSFISLAQHLEGGKHYNKLYNEYMNGYLRLEVKALEQEINAPKEVNPADDNN